MQEVQKISDIKFSQEDNVFILCDENTAKHCYPRLKSSFPLITIEAGESSKTLDSCQKVWDQLIAYGADRKSHLICLGGGMICDLGAFAASCFQRGISFTLVPTSLLAMVDAANGGKSGVDYGHLKNYIGLFTHAKEVIICTEFLETLPQEEWINGKMEMVKHGLICDAEHFEHLKGGGPNDVSMIDLALIHRSIQIKEHHCEHDRTELGIRKRLNFGHTIGHAIESYALELNQPIPHGLAVGLGMIAESYLSHTDWSLSLRSFEEIRDYLKPLRLKITDDLFNEERLFHYMSKDKKNSDQKIYFSLLGSIGNSQENILISEEHISQAIKILQEL